MINREHHSLILLLLVGEEQRLKAAARRLVSLSSTPGHHCTAKPELERKPKDKKIAAFRAHGKLGCNHFYFSFVRNGPNAKKTVGRLLECAHPGERNRGVINLRYPVIS